MQRAESEVYQLPEAATLAAVDSARIQAYDAPES